MAFQVTNIEQLQKLLESTELTVSDFEDLKQLLQTINRAEASPEERKEELAHQERMRALEHEERMRALELGQVPADPAILKAQAESLARVTAAAGLCTVFVPLGMAGAAILATMVILDKVSADYQIAGIAIIWGTSALVALLSAILGLGVLGERAAQVANLGKPEAEQLPKKERPSNSFKETGPT